MAHNSPCPLQVGGRRGWTAKQDPLCLCTRAAGRDEGGWGQGNLPPLVPCSWRAVRLPLPAASAPLLPIPHLPSCGYHMAPHLLGCRGALLWAPRGETHGAREQPGTFPGLGLGVRCRAGCLWKPAALCRIVLEPHSLRGPQSRLQRVRADPKTQDRPQCHPMIMTAAEPT